MLWSPTIRAALIAGTPWLDVFCPGCGTSRAIDLRTVDRHPLASVATLVLGLRCSWCPGSAPMPKLLGLYSLPPANRQATRPVKLTICDDCDNATRTVRGHCSVCPGRKTN
jgi:hypothetical protein